MSKLVIPHIHKTLGDAGFFSRISEKGEIEEIRINVLEGLRQIEGILIGRRIFETPLVISRICGICPTSHILNACQALEKALSIEPSEQTKHLRGLINSAQAIQSHSAHLFFMSLADFFNIEGENDLTKKFSKESKAVLQLRQFALKVIGLIGGRTVHPMTPRPGGFTKIPDRQDINNLLKDYDTAYKNASMLIKLFLKLDYPQLKRQTIFSSSFLKEGYPHFDGKMIKIDDKIYSIGDFFSDEISEDLKDSTVKRVDYKGKSYMTGAVARIKNNGANLDEEAKHHFDEFSKNHNVFENNFYNSFCQAVEIMHFLKEIKKEVGSLSKEKPQPAFVEYKISRGSGLGVLEAPRGNLFSYFEIDDEGRISNCNIVTPTAQFLRNLEADLKVLLGEIADFPKKKKIRRIKTLVRAYDPCISCAVH
jgi:coenzyme F420-reducing hydrogenase alpha subunit